MLIFFPENDSDGRRDLGPFVNVNELPDNYSKMTNDNLYLKIWQGKWTKQSDRPTAFVALIDLSGGNGPEWQVRQTQDENGITVEAKQSGGPCVWFAPRRCGGHAGTLRPI